MSWTRERCVKRQASASTSEEEGEREEVPDIGGQPESECIGHTDRTHTDRRSPLYRSVRVGQPISECYRRNCSSPTTDYPPPVYIAHTGCLISLWYTMCHTYTEREKEKEKERDTCGQIGIAFQLHFACTRGTTIRLLP